MAKFEPMHSLKTYSAGIYNGLRAAEFGGIEPSMAKLLLVDDDKELIGVVMPFLQDQGHVVDACHTGEEALAQIKRLDKYDLIILDWTMPGLSGFEVCCTYRKAGGQSPILFLTGRDDIAHLELALKNGADDYIAKPFDLRELKARTHSILRRREKRFVAEFSVQGVTLDLDRQVIYLSDRKAEFIKLRAKESALLEFLMRNPNRTHSAHALLDSCWPRDTDAGPSSVRTWMTTLRDKLEQLGKAELIQTVVGSGYMITDNSVEPDLSDESRSKTV